MLLTQPGTLPVALTVVTLTLRAALRHQFKRSIIRMLLDLLRKFSIWTVSLSEALEFAYEKFHDVRFEINLFEKRRNS